MLKGCQGEGIEGRDEKLLERGTWRSGKAWGEWWLRWGRRIFFYQTPYRIGVKCLLGSQMAERWLDCQMAINQKVSGSIP